MPRCEHGRVQLNRFAVLTYGDLQRCPVNQRAARVCANLSQAGAALVVALRRHGPPWIVHLDGIPVVLGGLIPFTDPMQASGLLHQVLGRERRHPWQLANGYIGCILLGLVLCRRRGVKLRSYPNPGFRAHASRPDFSEPATIAKSKAARCQLGLKRTISHLGGTGGLTCCQTDRGAVASR